MNRGQPLGGCRQQVECNHVLGIIRLRVEGVFEHVTRLQLGIGVRQANLDAIGIEKSSLAGDAVLVEYGGYLLQQLVVRLDGGADRRYLNRRCFTKKVR